MFALNSVTRVLPLRFLMNSSGLSEGAYALILHSILQITLRAESDCFQDSRALAVLPKPKQS